MLTHHLARALRGQEPSALDDERRLTSDKLFSYLAEHVTPTRLSTWTKGQANIVLGDFGKSVLEPLTAALLAGTPSTLAREVRFEDSRPTDVTEILTRIRNWALTESQIEHAANAALPEYSAPALGKLVPILRRALGFSQGTVMVEGGALRFPGGSLESYFQAASKRSGYLVRHLILDGSWFDRPEKIPGLVDVVGLVPETTTIVLRAPIELPSLIAGLESSSWTIVSELANEVQAEKLGSEWTFRVDSITVRGMPPAALFGSAGKGRKKIATSTVAGQALAVFAAGSRSDAGR